MASARMTMGPQSPSTQPSASGTFQKTPFEHVLVFIAQKALTGTLVLSPVKPTTNRATHLIFSGGQLLGLYPLVQDSVEVSLVPWIADEESRYAFYQGVSLLDGVKGAALLSLETFSVVGRCLRAAQKGDVLDARIERVLSVWGDQPIRVRAIADLDRMGADAFEKQMAEFMRAQPASRLRLERGAAHDAARLQRFLYWLTLCQLLERDSSLRSTEATSTQQFAHARIEDPPPSLPPELQNRWKDIIARQRALIKQNYFETLGLGTNATAAEVKKVYLDLVKVWHPDRLAKELSPLKAHAAEIFHEITIAHQTLSDEAKRDAYLKELSNATSQKDAEAQVRSALNADQEFQEAEVHFKRRDYVKASEHIQKALGLDATQPSVLALHAAIQFHQKQGDAAHDRQVLASLDKALAAQEKNERALYYKALLYKRMNKDNEALQWFKKVLEVSPHHIDAAREARLITMKSPKGGKSMRPGEKSGGFFQNLFKKTK